MNKELLVIGGGASGMMAAICAARKGVAVTLLEPNERLGKKLNITGKDKLPVYTTDNGKLKVTKNRNGTVKLVGVTSKAPKVLKPDYAVIKGNYYEITHIGEYAFKGNKKSQRSTFSAAM